MRRQLSSARGATLVEFAIVAVLFLTMILGVMEFGRMIFASNIVSNATREGARWAAVRGADAEDPATGTSIEATASDVQNYVVSQDYRTGGGKLTTSDITVEWCSPATGNLYPDCSSASTTCSTSPLTKNTAGNCVRVTTQQTFTSIVPLIPMTKTLGSVSSMVISR